MAPEPPGGAGAFPAPVETAPRRYGPTPRTLRGAGPGHEQLPHADCPARRATSFTWSTVSRSPFSSASGLERYGRLSRSSMARTLQALRICQQKIERHRVKRHAAWWPPRPAGGPATAAISSSAGERETGLLEIIEPEEEARLAVISCAPLVSPKTEQLLVVDIGGGSTELVWIDLAGARMRPDQGDHAAARRVHPPTATFPARGWSTGSACRWGWRRCATSSRCRGRRRALRADELVLRGKPRRLRALQGRAGRATGSRSSAPRAPSPPLRPATLASSVTTATRSTGCG